MSLLVVEVSPPTYREIREKLMAAGLDRALYRDDRGRILLLMDGMALAEDHRSNWDRATANPEVY